MTNKITSHHILTKSIRRSFVIKATSIEIVMISAAFTIATSRFKDDSSAMTIAVFKQSNASSTSINGAGLVIEIANIVAVMIISVDFNCSTSVIFINIKHGTSSIGTSKHEGEGGNEKGNFHFGQ